MQLLVFQGPESKVIQETNISIITSNSQEIFRTIKITNFKKKEPKFIEIHNQTIEEHHQIKTPKKLLNII